MLTRRRDANVEEAFASPIVAKAAEQHDSVQQASTEQSVSSEHTPMQVQGECVGDKRKLDALSKDTDEREATSLPTSIEEAKDAARSFRSEMEKSRPRSPRRRSLSPQKRSGPYSGKQ